MVDPLLTPYSVTAVGTLLVYDYLCTLNDEIAYIWTKPFSLGTVLFFLNRYLPFVDTFVSVHFLTAKSTPEECAQQFKPVIWLTVIGILIAEVILMVRTYALWERRRSILISFSILLVLVLVPAIVVTHLEVQSLVYVPLPDPSKPGCNLKEASLIIFVAYVLLMLCETTIAILTLIKAVQHLRRSRSSWVHQLYREGVLFYMYLLILTTANVVVPVAAPVDFANWLATPQRVIHSLLCTRVLFCIMRRRPSRDTRRGIRSDPRRGEEQTGTSLEFSNGSDRDQGILTTLPVDRYSDYEHDDDQLNMWGHSDDRFDEGDLANRAGTSSWMRDGWRDRGPREEVYEMR